MVKVWAKWRWGGREQLAGVDSSEWTAPWGVSGEKQCFSASSTTRLACSGALGIRPWVSLVLGKYSLSGPFYFLRCSLTKLFRLAWHPLESRPAVNCDLSAIRVPEITYSTCPASILLLYLCGSGCASVCMSMCMPEDNLDCSPDGILVFKTGFLTDLEAV